ncbi:response regulator [Aquimarina longa]|uniref:response regulator n=1 Tax=Aquimarina longa TaxID=1080221 RepID=UPI0009E845FB|nr:response regulator [Aquimarina longa]
MKLKLPRYVMCLLLHLNLFTLSAQVSDREITPDSIIRILKTSSEEFSKLTKEGTEKGIHLLELAENLGEAIGDPYLTILINREKISFFFNNEDTINIEKYLAMNLAIINKLDDNRQLGLYYEDFGVYKHSQEKREEGLAAMIKAEQLLNKYGRVEDAIDVNYNLSIEYLRREKHKLSIIYGKKSLNAIRKAKVKQNRRKNLYLFLAQDYTYLNEYEIAKKYFDTLEIEAPTYDNDPHYKGRLFSGKGFYYEEIGDYKNASLFYKKSSNSFFTYHAQRTKKVTAALILSSQLNLQEEENKRIIIENELKEQQLSNKSYIILLGILIILGLVILSIVQYNISRYKTKINKLLKRSYEELMEANRKVDNALRVKSEFLDSVTHELLTPLNTIKGTTFLLQKEELTKRQINQIKLINVSSDYLLNLITDVIHLNDLEKGMLELKNEEFDLKSLLNNLIDSSLMVNNSNDNKIHRNIDVNIPDIIKGDAVKVSQIFLNIFDNALKFTRNGDIYITILLISKVNHKVQVEFSIRDTGIGMTEKQIHKAFETFHQGSVKINRKYGGTGLGLSIVKKMLKLQGSDIVLESKPTEGTSVVFIIDFDVSKAIEDTDCDDNITDELSTGIHILLVEDNKVNQLITEKIISNYGFCCDSANDGEEAVDMVKKNKYSMILMDIMMPKMDGFEATKHIKIFDEKMPVVALTAISEKLNKEKFTEVGIYTILNKPVDPELLYQTIMKYCDKSTTKSTFL